jgi:hypothetical protein
MSAHNTRERPPENADPERKKENEHFGGGKTKAGVLQQLERRLSKVDRKVRHDAVLVMDFVISASNEWYAATTKKQQDDYHKKALEWVKTRYGAENVVQAVCHRDEKTPHLHIAVTPIRTKVNKKGKEVISLCAKDYLDGSAKLAALQTDFHNDISKNFGLDRGIEGSKARHQRIKSFYGALARETPAPEVEMPRKRIFERQKTYQERAKGVVLEQTAGWAAGTAKIKEAQAVAKLAAEAQEIRAEKEKIAVKMADLSRIEASLKSENVQYYENAQKTEAFARQRIQQEQAAREAAERRAAENQAAADRLQAAKTARAQAEQRAQQFQNFLETATPNDLQQLQAQWKAEAQKQQRQNRDSDYGRS